jgi:hypothetical protein
LLAEDSNARKSTEDNQVQHLIANLMIFQNCHTMTWAFNEPAAEGMKLTSELAAVFSPF